MNNLSYLFKRFLNSILFHPWMHIISILVLSSTLTIIFSLTLFLGNLESILMSWGSQVEMNVYLQDNMKQEQQKEIETKLRSMGFFKEVRLVAKEKAIESFFKKMSRYVPDFAEDKEFLNIIPASFFVTLEKTLPIDTVSEISKKILKISGIEDVSYGQEWIENFSVFLTTLKNTSLFISLVLILGGLFVIGFIIFILINRRKEEIEIFELCGATSKMIQAPYLFEGGMLCFISSVLALLASYVILHIQNGYLHSEMVYFGLTDVFQFFSAIEIIGFLIASVVIGVMVSYVCVKKLNTGWSAAGQA